jgi:hypothetical protein
VSKTLILSNYDPLVDTILYTNDRGSWNVSRALRDCRDGKHKLWLIGVAEAYNANKTVEVDEDKVGAFMHMPEILERPGVGVVEGGQTWFIDGHHRLRALARLSVKDFACYIIEEADIAPYIVWYNGKRKAPFKIEGDGSCLF